MFRDDITVLPSWTIAFLVLTIVVIVSWTLFWKAAGLWHAARKKDLGWFVAILIINSLGILEMIYLFGVEKAKSDRLFK